MVSLPSPDGLPRDTVDSYDVFLSFTRTTPGAIDEIERVVRALEAKRLTVFQDVRIDEFDGITARLVGALAGSKVLLAHYSKQFPNRYACQWELTAAFLAAQRYGDPRRRVLTINPEDPRQTDHIEPIELADAKFFGQLRGPDDYDRLAEQVAARVAAAAGPLGAAPQPVDPARLPAQLLRPRPFIGRYPQMWRVHSQLSAMDLTGVQPPHPQPAVMITGLAGSGKTSLAAQYAYLYRNAFPGGIFWIGALGGSGARGDATGVLGEYANQLRVLAGEKLDLAVGGVGLDRLRIMVADQLSRTAQRVLWIVDDVPPDLPEDVLDQLLVPSPEVRTVLTSRIGTPSWEAQTIALGGLSADDGLALFAVDAEPSTQDERAAVLALVERCGGHPMVIRGVANTVRNRRGLFTGDDLVRYLREAAPTVTETVDRELAGLDPLATEVLRVAAVLAPAPFPPSLVAGTLSISDHDRLGSAADQLAESGLLQPVGASWEVHPLVCEAVRTGADLAEMAARAAAALLALLAPSAPNLIPHARLLGGRTDVPDPVRLGLLRRVAEQYEAHGDASSALATLDTMLTIDGTDLRDLLWAAKVGIACGHYETASRQARRVIELTALTDDYRARDRARLLAAKALDHLGRYADADAIFWTRADAHPPSWMSPVERWATTLAIATAKRMRGQPKDALRLVEPLVVELRSAPPGDARTELVPAAKLELARLLQLTGKARRAREIAGEVIDHYRDIGMGGGHIRVAEAQGIRAGAYLTLDLTERDGKPENWQRSQRQLKELAGRYAEQFGAGNALTLAAQVRADRALLGIGEPERALRALAETEQEVVAHLGRDDPLLFQIRHGMALGHGQLREFAREAEILDELLPKLVAHFGKHHPETVEVQLDLGISLAMTGDGGRARPLVDEAARNLRSFLGLGVDLSAKATTAQWVIRLPHWALTGAMLLDRVIGPRKPQTQAREGSLE